MMVFVMVQAGPLQVMCESQIRSGVQFLFLLCLPYIFKAWRDKSRQRLLLVEEPKTLDGLRIENTMRRLKRHRKEQPTLVRIEAPGQNLHESRSTSPLLLDSFSEPNDR